MAQIDKFIEGLDRSRADQNFPTHAIWIGITNPGQIDVVQLDEMAARVNPYARPNEYEEVERRLKFLAFTENQTPEATANMVLFYPGFEHIDYLRRLQTEGMEAVIRSAGMVSVKTRRDAVLYRRVSGESITLHQAGVLTMDASHAFKMSTIRRHLEPPFRVS